MSRTSANFSRVLLIPILLKSSGQDSRPQRRKMTNTERTSFRHEPKSAEDSFWQHRRKD